MNSFVEAAIVHKLLITDISQEYSIIHYNVTLNNIANTIYFLSPLSEDFSEFSGHLTCIVNEKMIEQRKQNQVLQMSSRHPSKLYRNRMFSFLFVRSKAIYQFSET